MRFSVPDISAGVYDLRISYGKDIMVLENAFEVLEVKIDSLSSNLLWADYDENKKIYADDTLVISGSNLRNYPDSIDIYYYTNRTIREKISLDFEVMGISNDKILLRVRDSSHDFEDRELFFKYLNKEASLGKVYYFLPVKLKSHYIFKELYFDQLYFYYGEKAGDYVVNENGGISAHFPVFRIDDTIQVSQLYRNSPIIYNEESEYSYVMGYWRLPEMSLGEHTINFFRGYYNIPMRVEGGKKFFVEKPNLCFRQNEYSKQDTLSIELYSDNASAICNQYQFYRERKIFLVDNHDSSLRFECTNVRYEFVTNPRNPEFETTYFYFLPPQDIPTNTFYKVEYEAFDQVYDFETSNCESPVIFLKP